MGKEWVLIPPIPYTEAGTHNQELGPFRWRIIWRQIKNVCKKLQKHFVWSHRPDQSIQSWWRPWIWRDHRCWMVVVCYRWSDRISLMYPCCSTSLYLWVKRIWIWKFERHGLWNSPVLVRRVNTAIEVDHMVMIFMSSTQPSRAWIWIDDRQWMVKIRVWYLITSE